ncbi:MAG: Ig-like domain-containing protein [Bifidobacteriaceae bacterium]|jgi:hypothetical protein|nr:Ig-like domain-containing protein [Bifidobacteriaceae bacterium]
MKNPKWLAAAAAGVVLLAGVALSQSASAGVIVHDEATLPTVAVDSGSLPFGSPAAKPYRESEITYKGKANYYFVTSNGANYTNGQTVYVTFDDATGTGTVATSGVANGQTVFQATTILLPDANGDGAAEFTTELSAGKANSTLFVDGGTYFNDEKSAYTRISGAAGAGYALVGLTSPDGPNPVVFKKQSGIYGWGGSNQPTMVQTNAIERYAVLGTNLYWRNLVIDADGSSVLHQGTTPGQGNGYWTYSPGSDPNTNPTDDYTSAGGWHRVFSGSGSRDRGEYLFYFAGGASAYFKDVTARNVGKAQCLVGSCMGVTNGGFNIHQANSSPNNLEGVTFSNIYGSDSAISVYRIVTLKDVPGMNIKDLTIEWTLPSDDGSSQPLWVDYGASGSSAATVRATDLRFAGDLRITGYDDPPFLGIGENAPTWNRLALASNAFGNVTLPDNYRYAVFNVGTATGTSSSSTSTGGFSGQIYVYESLDDARQAWGSSGNYRQVLFDAKDGAWLVRQPDSTHVQGSVNQQLEGIETVLRRLGQAPSTNINANGRGLATDTYIKIVADGAGELPGFTMASFHQLYGNPATNTPNVHIKAVPDAETLFSAAIDPSGGADDTLVPFKAGQTITLSGPNNPNVRLYNIDFHSAANYTLQEAVAGIDTDPQASGIEQPETVPGSTAVSFAQCRFTALVEDLGLSVPLDTEDTTDDDDGDVYAVTLAQQPFTPTATPSRAYTAAGPGLSSVVPRAGFDPDDKAVAWESSDPAVASVNPTTGEVTVLSMGNATITGRALDSFNAGEITKPSVSFSLQVAEAPQPPPGQPEPPTDPSDPEVPGKGLPPTGTSSPLIAGLGLAAGLFGAGLMHSRRRSLRRSLT